jgi:UDP-N-acetylglucosamine 1-carboxyvinyltransferase
MFENRFAYVDELRKVGAKIEYVDIAVEHPKSFYHFNYEEGEVYNQAIRISGPQKLHNGVLNIADLRAGATLAIAALIAEGESIVNGAPLLERGYENFVEKVTALGGEIKRE